jgi:hypothetical protein
MRRPRTGRPLSLGTRFALIFATVAFFVAGSVGLLSFQAAAGRITGSTDEQLQATTTALAAGVGDHPGADAISRRGRIGFTSGT